MKISDTNYAIIYTLMMSLIFTAAVCLRVDYGRDARITEQLEAVETIVVEDVVDIEKPEEIDDTVFIGPNTVVSYSPIPEEVIEAEEIEEPVEIEETEVFEEVIEVPEITETGRTYFDVPLGDDLQDHIFNVCESYGVDPAIIVAMIYKESTYRADCMGDNGNAYGLMQVQPRWHQARIYRLGVTDLLDPYQNVRVGIDYFAELLGYEQGLNWSLMAYNGGITYANKKVAAGEVSGYVKVVTSMADELRASLEG